MGRCPHNHSALSFYPGFITAQTNRLRHVVDSVGGYLGMAAALGDQWEPYRRHVLDKYYVDWFTFFQRGPEKVIRCVGCVTLGEFEVPCGHAPPIAVDMAQEDASTALSELHMDHSIPKHLVCQRWKRAIALYKEANHGEYPSFTLGCSIDYIDYLLYSIVPDERWGRPLVRPRCSPREGSKCHVQEVAHLQRLGMEALAARINVVDPGERISEWLYGPTDGDGEIWI